jgi:hypothetical protein
MQIKELEALLKTQAENGDVDGFHETLERIRALSLQGETCDLKGLIVALLLSRNIKKFKK